MNSVGYLTVLLLVGHVTLTCVVETLRWRSNMESTKGPSDILTQHRLILQLFFSLTYLIYRSQRKRFRANKRLSPTN